jgi:hypothetical protein
VSERARTPAEATEQMDAELRMLEPPKFGAERVSELGEVADLLEAHRWRYASSMPDTPHEYTLLDWWDDAEAFYRCVASIRRHGERTTFRGWPYIEITLGDHRYWTMGYPVRETTLVNRRLARGEERSSH